MRGKAITPELLQKHINTGVAAEKAKAVLAENLKEHVDHYSGNCPRCKMKLQNYGEINYCPRCGQGVRWTP